MRGGRRAGDPGPVPEREPETGGTLGRHRPATEDDLAPEFAVGAGGDGAVDLQDHLEENPDGALSPRLSRYLLPTERLVVAVRRHPAQLAEPVASATLGLVLVLWADHVLPAQVPLVRDLLFLAWSVLLVRAVWRLLEWRANWFVATDRRLLLTYGVLYRRVAMMPTTKVTDMSYHQSLVGRLLNYGEFVLESAGKEQALRNLQWLPVPDQLYLSICAELFGHERMPPVLPEPGRRRYRRPGR